MSAVDNNDRHNDDQDPPLNMVCETRCYWALLSSELDFIYLGSHLAEHAPILRKRSLLSLLHPDERTATKLNLAGVDSRALRVRFSRLSYARHALGCPAGRLPAQDDKITLDATYMTVDLIIKSVAAHVILCFIHPVIDLSSGSHDEACKTPTRNWCGSPPLDPSQLQACYRALVSAVPQIGVGERVFQILGNGEGRPLLFSWPPDQGQSALCLSASDFAQLVRDVQFRASTCAGDSSVSESKMSCMRRYHALQALPTAPGGVVGSIFIPYGSIIFACHKYTPGQAGHLFPYGSFPSPPPSFLDHNPPSPYVLDPIEYSLYVHVPQRQDSSPSPLQNQQQGQEQWAPPSMPFLTQSVSSLPTTSSPRAGTSSLSLSPYLTSSQSPNNQNSATQSNSTYTPSPDSLPPLEVFVSEAGLRAKDRAPQVYRTRQPLPQFFSKLTQPHFAVESTHDGSVDRPPRRTASVHNSIPYARPRDDDPKERSFFSETKILAKTSADDLIAKTTQSNSGSPVGFRHDLMDHLKCILQDKQLYRRLVGCQPSDAQRLLDSFQQLRKSLNVAMRRISVRSGLYPTCYELKDVVQQGEYPVNIGGFADIYQGMFQGRVVCLKTIRLCRDDQIEHMLKATSKEAILWRQLLHPNVSTLFGLYRFRDRISIVSAWMDNGDITIYLKKNPTAPRQRLAVDVGRGLTYLHKNGIIHGDLKGANVLVDDVGRARLTDFGISSISDSQIIAWTTQSLGNVKGGSTRWQAPELFAVGDSDVDDEEVEAAVKNTMASDVYALGCVFFEGKIFTGDVPFNSIVRDHTVILRVLSGARPTRPPNSSPSWTEWELTEDIWACIEDCWKGQPPDRPPAAAVVQRLTVHLTEDAQRGPEANTQLPDEFRRRMSESFKMITVEELNRILGTQLQLTDHKVGSTARHGSQHRPYPPILGSDSSCHVQLPDSLSPSGGNNALLPVINAFG
ncbi:hypothetical protein DXG01_009620 [Tephrocybe rancida]|nr:hypothetical protein DXG01_009620 [Tephrocybe rancida]